jgi:tRNA(Arg) A34 adenosine deaminase TadA
MKEAITEALIGRKEGEPPFGGVLIDKEGHIIAKSHDTVVKDKNMTSHSEFNLVKIASNKIGPDLSGCTVVCTCEPCPLCFAALWLAKVSTVVFGSYISDILNITGDIQRELDIPAEHLNERSGNQIKLIKEVMRKDCIKIWEDHEKSLKKIK